MPTDDQKPPPYSYEDVEMARQQLSIPCGNPFKERVRYEALRMLATIDVKDAEIAHLQETLRFYADPKNYEEVKDETGNTSYLATPTERDRGARARAVLSPEQPTPPTK